MRYLARRARPRHVVLSANHLISAEGAKYATALSTDRTNRGYPVQIDPAGDQRSRAVVSFNEQLRPTEDTHVRLGCDLEGMVALLGVFPDPGGDGLNVGVELLGIGSDRPSEFRHDLCVSSVVDAVMEHKQVLDAFLRSRRNVRHEQIVQVLVGARHVVAQEGRKWILASDVQTLQPASIRGRFFVKYGENTWAGMKGYLDAVADSAAAPVIDRYTGVLAAADVFTAHTALWVIESIRLDLGVGLRFTTEPDCGRGRR